MAPNYAINSSPPEQNVSDEMFKRIFLNENI